LAQEETKNAREGTAIAIKRFRFDKSFLWFTNFPQKPFDTGLGRWHHPAQSHRRKQFRLVAFLLSASLAGLPFIPRARTALDFR
jgi:hypothetical protein